MLTYIERDVAGQKHIMPYIIRAANRKTCREIHHEIRTAQVEDVAKAVVGFKLVQFLPTLLFRFFFDHDIIDGASAARFAQRLKELIERGYGICESEVECFASCRVRSASECSRRPWA